MRKTLRPHQTKNDNLKPSFSGHQTFPFRYTWLKKGYDVIKSNPDIFTFDDAPVELGVGKNMVQSIRYWCLTADIIEQSKKNSNRISGFGVTDFGKAIFDENGFDPFLDDPATLWLIHWKIAANINQATTWYWAFNINKKNQFVRKTFRDEMYDWVLRNKISMRTASENTLDRDVNCFIRTYCHSRNTADVMEESFDCPLVELNLLSELSNDEGYEFQRGEKVTLPIEILTGTLIAFWDHLYTERDSLTFTDILTAPLSPGRIFRLDEDSLTLYLEKLDELTDSAMTYDETADLKQVYRHRDVDPMYLLKRYYG